MLTRHSTIILIIKLLFMSTLLKLKKINLKYQTGKEVIKVLQNINFETKTKKLGTFFIKKDSISPTIKSLSFNKGDWISNKNYIKFRILDKESGIKTYRGTINGKWVLFEYEYKKNQISYEFDKYSTKKLMNEVEINIEDMVGNKKIFKSFFYRKTK